VLDVGAVYRVRCQSELESVVFGRIMGAGDLDSADDVEVVLRPVRQRRGNDPDVDDVDSAREQSGHQSLVQSDSTRPIVEAYGDSAPYFLFLKERGVSSRNCSGHVFGQVLPGDTAYVVLAKNCARELHRDQRDRSATCPPTAAVAGCVFTAGALRCV